MQEHGTDVKKGHENLKGHEGAVGDRHKAQVRKAGWADDVVGLQGLHRARGL